MTGSLVGSLSPDDLIVLGYAREFFGKLSINKPEPDTVSWVRDYRTGDVIVAHGEVMLPLEMKEKVGVEDLRPLIASAIIHSYLMIPRLRRAALTRLVLPVGVAEIPLILGMLQAFRSPDTNYSVMLLVGIVLAWVAYTTTLVVLYLQYMKDLFYVADAEATRLVEITKLKQAMVKVQGLDLEPRSQLARRGRRPSMKQRIERIDKLTIRSS